MQGFIRLQFGTSAVVVALLSTFVVAQQPFVTVTSDDGTQYLFYRTGSPITVSAASSKCAAAGGTLGSLTSAAQVRATLWSEAVVDAVGEETALIWTGIKISWSSVANQRRLLQGSLAHREAHTTRENKDDNDVLENIHNVDSFNDNEDMDMSLIGRVARQLSAREVDMGTDLNILTQFREGHHHLPEVLPSWLHPRRARRRTQTITTTQHQALHHSRHRNLLAGDGVSPYLKGANLTWADGSDASFVLGNAANMGFLACNRKKLSECCGAVFDIGPDPYPGSKFPTIFFYPCGSEKVSGTMLPSGYFCAVAPAVAQLSKPTILPSSPLKAEQSPPGSNFNSSSGSAVTIRKCNPGSMPALKTATVHPCTKCKPNTYSDDGSKCKKCPAGTKSRTGASVCRLEY